MLITTRACMLLAGANHSSFAISPECMKSFPSEKHEKDAFNWSRKKQAIHVQNLSKYRDI